MTHSPSPSTKSKLDTQRTSSNKFTAWGQKLASKMNIHLLGFPIVAFDELPSTSEKLKELALNGAPEGLTVISRSRNQG